MVLPKRGNATSRLWGLRCPVSMVLLTALVSEMIPFAVNMEFYSWLVSFERSAFENSVMIFALMIIR